MNDGSTGISGVICDEYAAKHDNIPVIHQNNQGINRTRRNGVLNAQGEWITFSDADDTMPNDALQKLWEKHDGTDLVIGFPDNPVHNKDLTLEECRVNAITGVFSPLQCGQNCIADHYFQMMCLISREALTVKRI